MLDHGAARPRAEPEERGYLLERGAQFDGIRVLVGQIEEDGVLPKAVGHRELVDELVVAFDWFAIWRTSGNGRHDTGLGDVLADSQALPFWVAVPKAAIC